MILVYDIGTSVIKGAVFDLNACLLDSFIMPVSLIKNENPLFHEVNAQDWIDSFKEITNKLKIDSKKNIDAVVISGNGPTLLPADENGKPLMPAITWMDRRSVYESEIISELVGNYIDTTFILPKAFWIYNNRPDIYEKTRYFFSCPEYLSYILTGNPFTILPGNNFIRYFWTDDILNKIGLDNSRFPDFVKPGDRIGEISPKGESVFNIKRGTPVIAGGPDFIVSILGTGTVFPGRACDRAGTSEGINLCSDRMIYDKRLLSYGHVIEGFYNISGIISTSGKALKWFKTVSGMESMDYDSFFSDIKKVPAGSEKLLFLPYLSGERAPIWDSNARGVFLGLNLNHGKKEMAHAVLESIGFAIRDVIEVIEENDITIEDLRITGSPSKSPLWNQIKANITGKKILVPVLKESELAGDLCLALYGLGIYNNLAEASNNIVKIDKIFSPEHGMKDIYDEYFHIYRDTYSSLKNIFKDLSKMDKGQK